MADQSVIVKGYDNPVSILFSFSGDFAESGLLGFSEIKLLIGSEEYSTISDSDKLFIVGQNELRLKVGSTTTLAQGRYTPTIIGYTPEYDDGYVLSGIDIKPLSKIKVV